MVSRITSRLWKSLTYHRVANRLEQEDFECTRISKYLYSVRDRENNDEFVGNLLIQDDKPVIHKVYSNKRSKTLFEVISNGKHPHYHLPQNIFSSGKAKL